MNCVYCGSESLKTLETRNSPDNALRRRKECITCGKRFTTYEYIETIELMIRKQDARIERFDINKIVRGLQKACEKRSISMDKIKGVSECVRQDLMNMDQEVIASHKIGELVMKYLKSLDRVAYIRFASVHRNFEEPEDFQNVLMEVKT